MENSTTRLNGPETFGSIISAIRPFMSCIPPTNDMISGIPRAIVHNHTFFVFVCLCVYVCALMCFQINLGKFVGRVRARLTRMLSRRPVSSFLHWFLHCWSCTGPSCSELKPAVAMASQQRKKVFFYVFVGAGGNSQVEPIKLLN